MKAKGQDFLLLLLIWLDDAIFSTCSFDPLAYHHHHHEYLIFLGFPLPPPDYKPAHAIDLNVAGFKKNVFSEMDEARDVEVSQTVRRAFGNPDIDNTVTRLKKSEGYMTKVG